MKLYTFPSAPSPMRVHIFMQEKGIDIATEVVDMKVGAHLSEAYKAINPKTTVPALVLNDGTVISEVVAICRYLEASHPDKPLMGVTAKQQGLICEWDHRVESEGLMAIAEALRNQGEAFKHRALPGALDVEQIPSLVPRGHQRILAFMKVLNEQLENHAFVAGDDFSVADITAWVTLQFSRWIKEPVPEAFDNLHRWLSEMAKRPSMST